MCASVVCAKSIQNFWVSSSTAYYFKEYSFQGCFRSSNHHNTMLTAQHRLKQALLLEHSLNKSTCVTAAPPAIKISRDKTTQISSITITLTISPLFRNASYKDIFTILTSPFHTEITLLKLPKEQHFYDINLMSILLRESGESIKETWSLVNHESKQTMSCSLRIPIPRTTFSMI